MRRAFDPAIRAPILVGAVLIVLPVRLVAFFRITHEVGQRESIVHGDVIDAGARRTQAAAEQVGGPGHSRAEISDQIALAAPALIDHLKRLGVTSIELLPIHAFIDDRLLVEQGLRNYWGYNSLAFFAPEPRYAVDNALDEGYQEVLGYSALGRNATGGLKFTW